MADNNQQGQKDQKQQGGLKFMIDGTLNKCTLSIVAKPGTRIEFYAGSQVNPFQKRVVDDRGNPLAITTTPMGLGVINDVDLTGYECLKDMMFISAVSSDGKQSGPQAIPVLLPGQKAKSSKFLKIISPAEEVYIRHDKNEYPIDLITFDQAGAPAQRHVAVTADGTFSVLDHSNNPLAENVTRWEFSSSHDGTHHHVIKPIGFTRREVKYNVLGDTQLVTRILEFR